MDDEGQELGIRKEERGKMEDRRRMTENEGQKIENRK